ncbi:nucleotide-binding alpha-beta plait domain-containing protein [Tanacetum coccineum]
MSQENTSGNTKRNKRKVTRSNPSTPEKLPELTPPQLFTNPNYSSETQVGGSSTQPISSFPTLKNMRAEKEMEERIRKEEAGYELLRIYNKLEGSRPTETKPNAKYVPKDDSNEDESSKEESSDDEPAKTQARQTAAIPQATGTKTVFMGNLSYSIEENDIINFFKDVREVAEVRFGMRDEIFAGYGHVEFTTPDAAQKVVELNGTNLLGRDVKIDLTKERGGKSAYTPGGTRESNDRKILIAILPLSMIENMNLPHCYSSPSLPQS